MAALAVGATSVAAAGAVSPWVVWPLYALAQGTIFWGLFCIGHDCGHQSFSANKPLNDLVGNVVHASIMVPYHPWRISHRKHHTNHGHVENDESWHPISQGVYDAKMTWFSKLGRYICPVPLLAYPFYLWTGVPGKEGSHYDPDNKRLFRENERSQVWGSNFFNIGMAGVLAFCTLKLGLAAMAKLYLAPWAVYVVWLDAVTYLHHHGQEDGEDLPWYRGEEWSYLRGGLTTVDRDYGIFSNLTHNIGTHVVHHLFPAIPHYHLKEATAATKKVFGKYYREPTPCPGPRIGGVSLGLPFHLIKPLFKSLKNDHVVPDEGDVVFYQKAF